MNLIVTSLTFTKSTTLIDGRTENDRLRLDKLSQSVTLLENREKPPITGQTMTNERRLQITRHRLACEINALENVLASGNLDDKHAKSLQANILWLQEQFARTVKK